MIKVENWCGHSIRFIERNGEWWAILKDICDALGLRSKNVQRRLQYPAMTERVSVETSEDGSNDIISRGENKTQWMLAINEHGIYKALFYSRKLEAHKFKRLLLLVVTWIRLRFRRK